MSASGRMLWASEFRPDIQGMRAIAVLLVLVFHVFPASVTGGYVGVDVFFVISGYLITGILLKGAAKDQRVDYLKFYERRGRRLLPAASLALVVSGLAAFVFLPSTQWENTGWEVVASALYVENFFLYFEALDYLAADYDPSPFQHYWSLSIEEQFYIFWPVIIGVIAWVMARTRHSVVPVLGIAFGAVFAGSLALSVLYSTDDGGTYFLTQARIWELALGGLVALYRPFVKLSAGLSVVLRWLALLAILVAGVWFTSDTVFPGYAALLPTLGAALLLITGHSEKAYDPGALLALRPMRYIGDISYSLYLWHWPVVVFANALLGETPGPLTGLSIILISIVLAHLSKFHVEDRFRERPAGTGSGRSAIICLGFVAGSLAVAMCLIVPSIYSRGQAASLSLDFGNYPGALVASDPDMIVPDMPFIPRLEAVRRDNPEAYVLGCHVDQAATAPAPCRYGPEDAEHVLAIVGDSHAAQWIPALRFLAEQRDYAVHTYTKSSCEFIDEMVNGADEPYEACRDWYYNTLNALIELQPDLVITGKMTNTWIAGYTSVQDNNERAVRGFASAWQQLGEAGIPVMVIAQTPNFPFDVPDCVADHPDDPDQCAQPLEDLTQDFDAQLEAARLVPTATLVNMNDAICPSGMCRPVLGNILAFRDSHHLSATFSRTLGPALSARIVPLVEGRQLDIGLESPATPASPQTVAMATLPTGFDPGVYPGAMARIDPEFAMLAPEPLRPPLDRAFYDLPAVQRNGCHVGSGATGVSGCSIGPEDAEYVVVLAGDTFATQWYPALHDIAVFYGLRLHVRTRSRCPLLDAPMMGSDGQADPTCRAWSDATLAEIEALSPDLVITSLNWTQPLFGFNGPAAQLTGTEDALIQTWERLGDLGIPVLALASTPVFSRDPVDCLIENDARIESCSEPRRSVLPQADVLARAAETVQSATAISLNELLCIDDTCPPVIGNMVVYRSAGNLSATYAQSTSPALAAILLDALGVQRDADQPSP